VRSERGTQFRRWATERLREYLVKGITMDDQRLKNPPAAGSGIPDYFDELPERIRDIRASEKRMYLRVREIFALAADCDTGRIPTAEFLRWCGRLCRGPGASPQASLLAKLGSQTQRVPPLQRSRSAR
jgi:hypothetical protein